MIQDVIKMKNVFYKAESGIGSVSFEKGEYSANDFSDKQKSYIQKNNDIKSKLQEKLIKLKGVDEKKAKNLANEKEFPSTIIYNRIKNESTGATELVGFSVKYSIDDKGTIKSIKLKRAW